MLVLAVVAVDQITKWWAWRHSGAVTINPGGNEVVGNLVSSWFRSSASGAVLDVVDAGALAGVLVWIGRRRRPMPVLISSGLALSGWVSNLSDRLGLHYWTAPGSVRGAVDFLRAGRGAVYNCADIAIVAGTACLGVSLYCYRREERVLRELEAAMRLPRTDPAFEPLGLARHRAGSGGRAGGVRRQPSGVGVRAAPVVVRRLNSAQFDSARFDSAGPSWV